MVIATASSGRQAHRKLSFICQLTDPEEYEGGDFEMQPLHLGAPDKEQVKTQGTALIFPSFIVHKVNSAFNQTLLQYKSNWYIFRPEELFMTPTQSL